MNVYKGQFSDYSETLNCNFGTGIISSFDRLEWNIQRGKWDRQRDLKNMTLPAELFVSYRGPSFLWQNLVLYQIQIKVSSTLWKIHFNDWHEIVEVAIKDQGLFKLLYNTRMEPQQEVHMSNISYNS